MILHEMLKCSMVEILSIKWWISKRNTYKQFKENLYKVVLNDNKENIALNNKRSFLFSIFCNNKHKIYSFNHQNKFRFRIIYGILLL